VFLADTAAANVEVLFILGDLFEYWIGDDDLTDPFNEEVCDLLRCSASTWGRASASSPATATSCWAMHFPARHGSNCCPRQ
jgi:hypothetical protein